MRFFHFHELAAVSPGFPPLVTKTNGMYLFHGTPASGFLLSPLCIALVKHFFLSSFLSSLLLVFLPSLISLSFSFFDSFSSFSSRAFLHSFVRSPFFPEPAPFCRSRSPPRSLGSFRTRRRRNRGREKEKAKEKEFGIARVLNEILRRRRERRKGAKVRIEKDTWLEISRGMGRAGCVEAWNRVAQTGYKFQVKFSTKLKGRGILYFRFDIGRCHRRPRTKFRRVFHPRSKQVFPFEDLDPNFPLILIKNI